MSILEKFTVIDLIRTRSASVATVTGNILKFNNQTAAELHYAPYIQVLINTKDKQFAIRACDKDAPNALPFSKPEVNAAYKPSPKGGWTVKHQKEAAAAAALARAAVSDNTEETDS